MEIHPIAHFKSPFTSKFGVPKQSGLVEELRGEIVFEPKYRNADYLRGLEEFDFVWLVWEFSANRHQANSPVVRLLCWEEMLKWESLPLVRLFVPMQLVFLQSRLNA